MSDLRRKKVFMYRSASQHSLYNKETIIVKTEKIKELRRQLKQETSKPYRKWNTRKIEQLNDELFSMICSDDALSEDIEVKQKRLINTLKSEKSNKHFVVKSRFFNKFTAIAVSVFVILGANTVSLKVYGENIFSSVYHLSKNGITWRSYELPEDNKPFVPDNDPYDIGKRIYEWEHWDNLGVLIPTYLPKGFEEFECKSNDNEVSFRYVKGDSEDFFENAYVAFYIVRTPKGGSFRIPCDEYNISKINVENFDGVMFKEDMQMKAVFDISEYVSDSVSNYYIYLSTMNIPYTEAEKVLSTMKEYKE